VPYAFVDEAELRITPRTYPGAVLVTLRDIRSGEELLVDYGFDPGNKLSWYQPVQYPENVVQRSIERDKARAGQSA
jgi:SET domain-containing protein